MFNNKILKIYILILSGFCFYCNPYAIFGWKPALHKAAYEDDVSKILSLINKGDNVNEIFHDSLLCESTPLHHAASNGAIHAAKILIDHGAKVNSVNSFGDTPLHIAAGITPHYSCDLRITRTGDGSYEIAKLLIEKGADMNIKNSSGNAPIHNAVQHGRYDIVKLLVENGADINVGDDGYTPFILCANNYYAADSDKKNSVIIASYLLKKGASSDSVTKSKSTAMHLAAVSGNIQHIEFLIKSGKNINAQNLDGDTPLHKAALNCQYDAVKKLLMFSAQKNIYNKNGERPLELAKRSSNCNVKKDSISLLKNE